MFGGIPRDRIINLANYHVVNRPLESHEELQYGDLVEDLQIGDTSRAEKGSFYGSLVGLTAAQLKQLPFVNEVIRQELHYEP